MDRLDGPLPECRGLSYANMCKIEQGKKEESATTTFGLVLLAGDTVQVLMPYAF